MNITSFTRFTDYCVVAVDKVTEYFTQGFIPFGSVFYHHITQRYCQVVVKLLRAAHGDLPYLTKREKDCLSCLSRGFSMKLMADELCCSEKNVERVLRDLRLKFNVKKSHLAVSKAEALGLEL